jgi:hypothetical protein
MLPGEKHAISSFSHMAQVAKIRTSNQDFSILRVTKKYQCELFLE